MTSFPISTRCPEHILFSEGFGVPVPSKRIRISNCSLCDTASGALHAPFPNRPDLNRAEDDALHQQPDEDDTDQPGEHVIGLELIALLEDEPADAAGAGRDPEHH